MMCKTDTGFLPSICCMHTGLLEFVAPHGHLPFILQVTDFILRCKTFWKSSNMPVGYEWKKLTKKNKILSFINLCVCISSTTNQHANKPDGTILYSSIDKNVSVENLRKWDLFFSHMFSWSHHDWATKYLTRYHYFSVIIEFVKRHSSQKANMQEENISIIDKRKAKIKRALKVKH